MLEAEYGFVRNDALLEGANGNALPDFADAVGFVKAKAGGYVYNSSQMINRVEGALAEGRQLDLLVSPTTRVSGPLIQAIQSTGGSVCQFANGAWTQLQPVVNDPVFQELLAPLEDGIVP
jgi:hypothetical protein